MEGNLKWLVVGCALMFIGVYGSNELDTLSEADKAVCDNANNRCQNGGKCIGNGREKFCKCRRGTSGDFCQTIDDCASNICGEGTGKDVFCMYDQTINSAVCICKQEDLAFDRVEEQCRWKCDTDKDCANGASCLQQGIGDKENATVGPKALAYCRCLPDTSGEKCENVLSCDKDEEFCGKDAKVTCYFDVAEKMAKCACPDNKTVFDDVSKTCKDCDCGEKALNCSYEEGAKQCICEKGSYFADETCKDCECGEQGLDCMLENGEKRCICKVGYFDVDGKCVDCACGPQAKGCSFKGGEKVCDCKQGFKQNGDVCENCNCRRNFKDCDFIDGAMTCTCDQGYTQKDDICVEACSADRPCKNGGICEDGVCKCKKGTGGIFCQIVTKCEYNNPCPNVWGITCTYDEGKEDVFCDCRNPGEVYVEAEKKCKKTCDNDENTCKNGASCKDKPEGKLCECLAGTSGDLCDTIDKCRNGGLIRSFCGTNTGIVCKYDADEEKPYCHCTEENQIYVKESLKCITTCEDDGSCKHGGTCEAKGDEKFCKCLKGTSGDLCEIIDQCTPELQHELCGRSEHVKCDYDKDEQKAFCFCDHEDQEFITQTKKCTTKCDTSKNVCKWGECKTTDDGDFCACTEGFSGDLCNIVDACEGSNPLCGDQENVECTYDDTLEKPVCKCQNGAFDYKMKACREQCSNDSKPCEYGDPCVSSDGGDFCQCRSTLSGDFCKDVKACQQKDFCGTGEDVDCIYEADTKSNAVCRCHDTNKKFNPALRICRNTCEDNSLCNYNSPCVLDTLSNNSFCNCSKGLSGDFCLTLDDCNKTCGGGNDVECVYDLKSGKVNCSCTNETKRFDKVEKQCRVPCNYDCKSDGMCRRYSNDPNRDDSDIGDDDATFCRCWRGSRGDSCEIVEDCENGKVQCPTEEGAICVYTRYLHSGYCACVDEKKEFDTVTNKCYECDCGNRSNSCSFIDGAKWCNCYDSAYQRDSYCHECACGANSKNCYYDHALREKKCNCDPNFSQINGVCEPCYCGPNSKQCSFTNGKMHCECNEGFIEKDEYCQPACNKEQPCKYGGECEDGLCQCKKGTAGTFCQIIVDCSNNEICGREENVLCSYDEERQEAYCGCNGTGLIFDDDKKECVECNCAEKGVCSLEKGKKQCTCIPTYGSIKGECTECQGCGDKVTTCSLKDEKLQCQCERGFADKNGICTECDCGESGDCLFINEKKTCVCHGDYGEQNGTCVECKCGENSEGCTFDEDDEPICKCKKGFLQRQTKCKACDCGEKGTCSFNKAGQKECDCDSGYAEKDGKCVEECNNNCHNGGKCDEFGESNFCNCSKGTSGDLCEIIDDCTTVYKDCKDDFGTCMYNETKKAAYCECDHDTIYDGTLKRCKIACSKDVPCENGGKCKNSVCQCNEGTSGDLCSTVAGCAEIEEKCFLGIATCKYAPDKPGKAECGCLDEDFRWSEEQKGCRAIWCLENSCAADARCYFEVTTKTAYCACNNKSLYYNNTGMSCDAVDACLFSEDCEKFEVCANGKCVCPSNHEETDDGCRPKFCATKKCNNFYGSNCYETDLKGTVNCVCGDGYFYDGSSQCRDGDCFLPNRWRNCDYGCPDEMEKTVTGCRAKDENKTCEKDCGEYGFCMKEGTKEECKCLPRFAKMASGSCVLDASVVCASKKLNSNSTKCECSGILKYAENGITCEKKTCTDKDVQEECARVKAAECRNNWNNPGMEPGSGYECLCGPGYSKNANNICTEKCKLESHASECAARGQICVLDDLYNANCKCPPTTTWNETTKSCDILNENTFMIQNLPAIKKKYMNNDGSVDKMMLNADIVKAMKAAYQIQILDYAYLYNYTESKTVLNCSVVVQFKQPTKWDIQRYQFSTGIKLNCENCSVYLLPPVLLDKDIYKHMSLEKLNFCSNALRNSLCGAGSECNANEKRCFCRKGYRTIDSTVHETRDFTSLRCEDIDECLERIDTCTENTTCTNTLGDYYCKCKEGFKKLSDTIPYKNALDKESCSDFCTPSPCVKGSCNVKEKGFDCSCVIGYSGSLCDRADTTLKKSNDKSKIIGGVLGALLGVTVLAFIIYFFKKRSQENSEAEFIPSRPADNAEMAERRLPRGTSNRGYE